METTEPFDALMAMLDPPMVVVTAAVGGERGGCLVGFHAQTSIAPGRYTVWLSKANHTYRLALRATHLGLHFLDRHDLALAERFGTLTGDEVDKFADLAVRCGPGAAPELTAHPHRMVVRCPGTPSSVVVGTTSCAGVRRSYGAGASGLVT
ncbi:flavin reductase family protein, partial [Rhodococcus aetherivorans]